MLLPRCREAPDDLMGEEGEAGKGETRGRVSRIYAPVSRPARASAKEQCSRRTMF